MARKKKEEAERADLNSTTTAAELRQFIERVERLEADKKGIAEDIKEVFEEAKGRGYDTKIMRRIIAERKRSADDIAEEEAVLDVYRTALGMIPGMADDDEDGGGDEPTDDMV